jgi:hypothetical protein
MDILFAMGFEEEPAEGALQRCSGNVDQAIDFLLSNPPESESLW